MILKIGTEKVLDKRVIERNKIIAAFGICNNTLCVQEHAFKSYSFWIKRSGRLRGEFNLFDPEDILDSLFLQLSDSFPAKRDRGMTEHIVYRFKNGMIFVLEWFERFQFWLLKTAYGKPCPRSSGFTIKAPKKDKLALTWDPSFAC